MENAIWQTAWANLTAVSLLVFQLTGLFLAARVILSNRSTQGTIAWILSLMLLPVAAVPMYLLFGRNRLEFYVKARRSIEEKFKQEHASVALNENSDALQTDTRWHILENLANMPLAQGHSTRFFFDGQATFDAMLKDLESAESYLLFQFFIFRDDPEGARFIKILKQKAKAGLRVYFHVDAIGSRDLSEDFFTNLKSAGIHTEIFLPGHTLRGRLRLNFRNHRKIIIIDGHTAWVGGHNIGKEYVGNSPRFGPWRDSHLRIQGPTVKAIQLTFLKDWYWMRQETIQLNWTAAKAMEGSTRALCLATGPTDQEETCALAYVHMINQAQERLWIHSPYFVPSDEVIIALQLASLRGVDVRILIPGKMDHLLVWLSSFYFSSLPQLNNVRFFRYKKGFLHSKMLLVDNDLASVGTVNFDNRSFRINFEITLILKDPEKIQECHVQMLEDFSNANEDSVNPLKEKSLLFRLAARGARLLSPLL